MLYFQPVCVALPDDFHYFSCGIGFCMQICTCNIETIFLSLVQYSFFVIFGDYVIAIRNSPLTQNLSCNRLMQPPPPLGDCVIAARPLGIFK